MHTVDAMHNYQPDYTDGTYTDADGCANCGKTPTRRTDTGTCLNCGKEA